MQRGFSLIELTVVVALVAIASAMAAPAFRNAVVNNRLALVSNSLVGAIDMARSEAVRRRVNAFVLPNGSWSQGWSVCRVNVAPCSAGNTVMSYTTPAGSVALTNTLAVITFNSRGLRNPVAAMSFNICDTATGRGKTLSVDPTGAKSITSIDSGCTP